MLSLEGCERRHFGTKAVHVEAGGVERWFGTDSEQSER
jgi:hypothetical protein